jgi:hypothetical protein
MADRTSKILASRLGRLAGPGFLGAWLMSHFLPENVGEATFAIASPPEAIRTRAAELLSTRGELLSPGDLEVDSDVVAAVVGAGRMALNPTVVTVSVRGSGGGSSTVSVRAVAKEGLVKQRAGDEVAAWLRAKLS